MCTPRPSSAERSLPSRKSLLEGVARLSRTLSVHVPMPPRRTYRALSRCHRFRAVHSEPPKASWTIFSAGTGLGAARGRDQHSFVVQFSLARAQRLAVAGRRVRYLI